MSNLWQYIYQIKYAAELCQGRTGGIWPRSGTLLESIWPQGQWTKQEINFLHSFTLLPEPRSHKPSQLTHQTELASTSSGAQNRGVALMP